MPSRQIIGCVAAAALVLFALPLAAQQQPPPRAPAAAGGTPRPPTGIVVPPLGAGPFVYQTAEERHSRRRAYARASCGRGASCGCRAVRCW